MRTKFAGLALVAGLMPLIAANAPAQNNSGTLMTNGQMESISVRLASPSAYTMVAQGTSSEGTFYIDHFERRRSKLYVVGRMIGGAETSQLSGSSASTPSDIYEMSSGMSSGVDNSAGSDLGYSSSGSNYIIGSDGYSIGSDDYYSGSGLGYSLGSDACSLCDYNYSDTVGSLSLMSSGTSLSSTPAPLYSGRTDDSWSASPLNNDYGSTSLSGLQDTLAMLNNARQMKSASASMSSSSSSLAAGSVAGTDYDMTASDYNVTASAAAPSDELTRVPVEIVGASCDALRLNIGTGSRRLFASNKPMTVAYTLDLTPAIIPASSSGTDDSFCLISQLVNGDGSTAQLVTELNRMIGYTSR